MKHLALRSKSMRNGDRPFTTPGLGDRVHSVLLGHLYSLLHDDKVTIHLTADKNDKPRKQQSWPEIISLFLILSHIKTMMFKIYQKMNG